MGEDTTNESLESKNELRENETRQPDSIISNEGKFTY